MDILYTIPIASLHLLALIDAIQYRKDRNGIFRIILALFPPIIGPIVYYLTKRKKKRVFLKGRKRIWQK